VYKLQINGSCSPPNCFLSLTGTKITGWVTSRAYTNWRRAWLMLSYYACTVMVSSTTKRHWSRCWLFVSWFDHIFKWGSRDTCSQTFGI